MSIFNAVGLFDTLTLWLFRKTISSRRQDVLPQKLLLTNCRIGVDSLVTIELRNWLRRRLGIEVTTLEILSSSGGTIESLGCIAVERLKSRFCIVTETVLDAATIEK